MHERQGRLDVRIREVGEHPLHLVGDQHPLVDNGVGRQARDVEEVPLGQLQPLDRAGDPLADDEQLALEAGVGVGMRRKRLAAPDQDLADDRLSSARRAAERRVVRGNAAPAEHALAFLGDDVREQVLDLRALDGVARQEHHAHAVFARRRQIDAEHARFLAEEAVRQLQQHAGAVAGVRLAAARAAVQQVDDHLERLPHDPVRPAALDVDDESHAARVVFLARVVEALRGYLQFAHAIRPWGALAVLSCRDRVRSDRPRRSRALGSPGARLTAASESSSAHSSLMNSMTAGFRRRFRR